jgi:hypothetical protein
LDRRELVVTPDCRGWRGDLAARALGRAEPARDPGLDAHLDGCADCRAELEDLLAMADALALADLRSLTPARPDPTLGERVVTKVTSELRVARRRRRARAGAAVAAAAALALAVVAISDAGGNDPASQRIALSGADDVGGQAELTARSWGTEVELDASGLEDGEVYWVWLSSDGGDRVVAGTLTGTGGEVRAVLASAVPYDHAARVWMTGEDDQVVLDGRRP